MRISYAGGGTDLESYYLRHGGLVVSTSIAKYFYVVITPNEDGALQVSSSDFRAFLRYNAEDEGAMGVGGEIKHAQAALKHFKMRSGYSVFMASEVPSGTGLGSSSAVAVALVKGLSTVLGHQLSKAELAEKACQLELDELKMPIGRQDQYASAFGGLNSIRFSADGVCVEPIQLEASKRRRLEDCTLLFHTGLQHNSAELLDGQQKATEAGNKRTVEALHNIRAIAAEAETQLRRGEVDALGELMDTAWRSKRQLTEGVTNARIDNAYEVARRAGALGGKIAGAGGGGFLLLYCPPPSQQAVTRALHELGLVRFDTRFDSGGARVLMNNVA